MGYFNLYVRNNPQNHKQSCEYNFSFLFIHFRLLWVTIEVSVLQKIYREGI